MELDRTRTTFGCACRRCGNRWLHEYDVVEWTDTEGVAVQSFSDHGISVPCPYQHGVACPHCGGLRVDVIPARPGAITDYETAVADGAPAEPPAHSLADAVGARVPFGPPFPAF